MMNTTSTPFSGASIPGAGPWSLEAGAFPFGADDAAQLRFLVRYAILAPSGHNTQPWLFRVRGGQLDLLADRTRALPVVDPHDRALVISCGAALANLLVAAKHFGLELAVESLPDAADHDLLARVTIAGRVVRSTPEEEQLFEAIPRRRTNRRRYEPEMPAADVLSAAAQRCEKEGSSARWISDPAEKHRIALLIAEGDRAQMADPRFRRELASWVHARRSVSRDGLSGYAMGMPDMLSAIGALIIRTFDMGKGQAAKDQALAEGSPVLAALTTAQDTPADWLAAGRGMQMLLLTLTGAGLSASYLNQPIEVESLRPALAEAIGAGGGKGYPQILLRVGRGPALEPSMRRDPGDVIVES
jgi:hypothetical protein